MYLIHNEGKSAPERFIRTLKTRFIKIYDFNIKECVY